jgi:hypothetical protein
MSEIIIYESRAVPRCRAKRTIRPLFKDSSSIFRFALSQKNIH